MADQSLYNQAQVIYNPQIQVLIATNNGVIDVSPDIVSFQVDRVINAVSKFQIKLNNTKRKYTIGGTNSQPVIQTMDRIVVNLTKLEKTFQVFSGYVTVAPIIAIMPNSVDIEAECTLKRLQNTFWDSSVPTLRAILPGMMSKLNNQGQFSDGGAAQGMQNLLEQVVGWHTDQIKIQEIPHPFLEAVGTEFKGVSQTLDNTLISQLATAVDSLGTTSSTADKGGTGTDLNGGTFTNYSWASTILTELNCPITQNNVNNFTAWMWSEENHDKWWIGSSDSSGASGGVNNPLNIGPGTNFQDLSIGATETAKLIAQFTDILNAFQKDSSWDITKNAIANAKKQGTNSVWGTGVPPATPGNVPTLSVPNQSTPSFNETVNKVIAAARSQIGVPYVWGAESPGSGFDCSGLTMWAYAQAGITLPHYSGSQLSQGPQLPPKNTLPQPGDLIFYGQGGDEHVIMCTVSPKDLTGAGGKVIQAPQTGSNIFEGPMDNYQTNQGGITGLTRPTLGIDAIASGPNTSGTSNQDSSNSSSGAKTSTIDSFNTMFILPQFNPVAQMTYGSPRGFIFDEPVLNSVQQLCAASFREFMSLGDGTFVAWFPDYFGLYGNIPPVKIYNVEITDLTLYHNDDALTTHVAVAGDTTGIGQAITPTDWLSTTGIISIQTENVMNILLGKNAANVNFNSDKFMQTYGMRPYVTQQPLLRSQTVEFTYALMIFMQMWAAQFSTNAGFTFMPEIMPGMRLQFQEIIINGAMLECYVQSVSHQGDMNSGFTTNMVLTAPSAGGSMIYMGFNDGSSS